MKQEKASNKGVIAMIICGIIAMAIIVACVFFPEEVFGIFLK